AVLVRAGKVIGQGWHKQAGGPHAEIFALASNRARGATLYVTLEPCCTHGRTPPCTAAIIAAGIRRVVIAARDPNPRHNGRGLAVLRRAGIRCDAGLLADEATNLNATFNKWITTGKPLVTAKAALSLDGKMSTRTGDSKWITSDAARREAHQLRARADAVMVGAGTVLADNPSLTLRHGVRGSRPGRDKQQPWRIVVDARGRCSLKANLFRDAHRHRTIVCTTARSPVTWRRALALRNVTVLVLPAKDRHVNLPVLFSELGRMEITSVLVEGGAELLGACFAAGLVDQVAFFFAPKIIGHAATMQTAVSVTGHWRRIGRAEMLFTGATSR
ncbi:MAG: bifunctional diaminohydroxyphosphoribosylaminopyrimidine deaminase/5-amino-6-(5-phosphoribosylamino)uracil reductase RibD, partial [Verrucomicrobiota bacterium]